MSGSDRPGVPTSPSALGPWLAWWWAPPLPSSPSVWFARNARSTALGLWWSRTRPAPRLDQQWWWAPVARASRAVDAASALTGRSLPAPPAPDAHPVAAFGAFMATVERQLWRDERRAGVVHAAIGAGVGAAAGAAAGPPSSAVAVCAAGAQLRDTAGAVADALEADDLDLARHQLRSLCGRDASALDAGGLAAAAIESVAENMVDAVVATACWAVVAGGAGAGAHRAINTMDAMVGHRTDRHRRYGWAAARVDDLAAFVPARLFAALVAAVRPDRAAMVGAVVVRDAGAHPSPNAGVAEAAMAAALGVELGGPLRYGDRAEDRPRLGDGPRPTVVDLRRAIAVADDVERLLIGGLATIGVALAAIGGSW